MEVPERNVIESKYTKKVVTWKADGSGVEEVLLDFYIVARAFPMSPEIQHAVKKLLMSGGDRGHKDALTDATEAIKSIESFIERLKAETALKEAHTISIKPICTNCAHGQYKSASDRG